METTSLFEQEKLTIINLGLEVFNDAVNKQNATGVQVNWRPPAGGNYRLIEIIERLREMD